jgi:hypothetical protein
MHEKRRINKIGIVVFKSGLTVVAFVIAAGLAGKFNKEIAGLNYASPSIAYIFMLGMIVPIWYGAPFGWRIAAASAGIAAGVGTWLISLSVGLSDIALSSKIIGFVRTAAIGVSLLVCVSILRAGRLRKGGDAARAIPARSFPPGVR